MTGHHRFFRSSAIALALLALPACSQPAETPAEHSSNRTIIWPGEDWAASTPEAEGVDGEAIAAIIADLDAGEYGLVDHFLVIRNGHVIADHRLRHDYAALAEARSTTTPVGVNTSDPQYDYDDPDWHPYYAGSDLHSMQSVTKSVTSAVLGTVIQAGLITDIDGTVLPYFQGYEHDISDPRKQAISLQDLLTMRSGISWVTEGGYADSEHSTIALEASQTWIQFILDRPMDAEPGTVFEYNDGASVLIGKIIGEATGQRADEWAREHLFEPIGIDEFYWKITPDGEVDTEGGLYLTTHDLARIGYLFLREGEWQGQQILPASWVTESTRPTVADINPDNDRPDIGYGYQWWIPRQSGGETDIYAANGYGGQFMHVSPEHELIVVVNGWNIHPSDARSSWTLMEERVLTALQ